MTFDDLSLPGKMSVEKDTLSTLRRYCEVFLLAGLRIMVGILLRPSNSLLVEREYLISRIK